MNHKNDSYRYAGNVEDLPRVREGKRRNKADIDDKLKRAITARMQ